jgi:hypothetical protein
MEVQHAKVSQPQHSQHPAGPSWKPASFVLGALALLAGCGPARFDPVPPLPVRSEAPQPEAVLYLVGDAGDPASGSPILDFLREDATARAGGPHVAIAFLGDNIYESGLHAPGHAERDHDERALELQLDVVRRSGARGILVPGNHDWGPGGEAGLEQIRRQAAYVSAAAGESLDVAFLPIGGCPGPVMETLGETALLVAIDTEWLLRYEREPPVDSACEPASAAEAYRALREIFNGPEAATRRVVVLAHHTLKTNGSHGGYFGLKDQLFPLTHIWAPLYLPIPFLYPIGRNSGISHQDMSNPTNRRMRDSLAAAAADGRARPLAVASGHEHSLQVFRGADLGADWLLVSGAASRLRSVEKGDALFAAGSQHGERGFMRLEFFLDGRVLLTVITDGAADCRGAGEGCRPGPAVRYWSWLRPPSG